MCVGLCQVEGTSKIIFVSIVRQTRCRSDKDETEKFSERQNTVFMVFLPFPEELFADVTCISILRLSMITGCSIPSAIFGMYAGKI